METDSNALMGKKMDELTVGETLKVTAIVTLASTAVCFAVPAVVIGYGVVSEKLATRKHNREMKKFQENAEKE